MILALYGKSDLGNVPSPLTTFSPEDVLAITPNSGSVVDGPSPLTEMRHRQMAVQRARLLFQGQNFAPINSLSLEEARFAHFLFEHGRAG
jgi:hypothetical protein